MLWAALARIASAGLFGTFDCGAIFFDSAFVVNVSGVTPCAADVTGISMYV